MYICIQYTVLYTVRYLMNGDQPTVDAMGAAREVEHQEDGEQEGEYEQAALLDLCERNECFSGSASSHLSIGHYSLWISVLDITVWGCSSQFKSDAHTPTLTSLGHTNWGSLRR